MAKTFSEKGKAVLAEVLRAAEAGENITFMDIAEATGLNPKTVTGVITATRIPGTVDKVFKRVSAKVEVETEDKDGNLVTKEEEVKFIQLTDEAKDIDVDYEAPDEDEE